MGVSVRRLISDIPKDVVYTYFERYAPSATEKVRWTIDRNILDLALERAARGMGHSEYEAFLVQLERIENIANPQGIRALINASKYPAQIEQKLQSMENDTHRSMAVFLEDEVLFKTAECVLKKQPDIHSLASPRKEERQDQKIPPTITLSLSLDDSDFISRKLLEKLSEKQAPSSNSPLSYAPDFSCITLNGETHYFKGKQQDFVKHLVKAYETGKTAVRTTEIMTAIHVDYTRRITHFFGKHTSWRRLIEYGNPRGYCRLRI